MSGESSAEPGAFFTGANSADLSICGCRETTDIWPQSRETREVVGLQCPYLEKGQLGCLREGVEDELLELDPLDLAAANGRDLLYRHVVHRPLQIHFFPRFCSEGVGHTCPVQEHLDRRPSRGPTGKGGGGRLFPLQTGPLTSFRIL